MGPTRLQVSYKNFHFIFYRFGESIRTQARNFKTPGPGQYQHVDGFSKVKMTIKMPKKPPLR